ncbi:MAG: hypothetical protein LWW98_05450 [Deltaproteobacteria bacterium]|nr:hypothetical protein [Deltaproteobacteria bacterium]
MLSRLMAVAAFISQVWYLFEDQRKFWHQLIEQMHVEEEQNTDMPLIEGSGSNVDELATFQL